MPLLVAVENRDSRAGFIAMQQVSADQGGGVKICARGYLFASPVGA